MVSTRSAVHVIRLLLLVSLSRCRANEPRSYHMERMCGQSIEMINNIDAGEIHFTLQPTGYPRQYDCVVYIATDYYHSRINFYFSNFDLMDDCWHNRATVTVREIDRLETADIEYVPGFPAYVCGRTPNVTGQAFATTSRYLAIRYQTPTRDRNANFKLIFNSFSNMPCQSYEHLCDNRRCILKDMTCNGRNPCGDHSDCERLSKGQIAGIAVGVSVFLLIVAFLYFGLPKIVKSRVKRREEIRMNGFRERESELETAYPYLRGTGGVSSEGNDTRVESRSSNGGSSARSSRNDRSARSSRNDRSARSSRNDRSDAESSELRVRLPDIVTNATCIPARTSNLPPSYETLEQITSISGAQTILGIRTDTTGRAARHTRSAHGQGVNIPSRDYNREHPSTDSVHESMSGGAIREPDMRTAATAGARVDRRDGDTGPSAREYAAPPPSYMAAMTFSDVYKVTSPVGSNV